MARGNTVEVGNPAQDVNGLAARYARLEHRDAQTHYLGGGMWARVWAMKNDRWAATTYDYDPDHEPLPLLAPRAGKTVLGDHATADDALAAARIVADKGSGHLSSLQDIDDAREKKALADRRPARV